MIYGSMVQLSPPVCALGVTLSGIVYTIKVALTYDGDDRYVLHPL